MHGFTGYRILRRSEEQPKHLQINIILGDTAWDGMDTLMWMSLNQMKTLKLKCLLTWQNLSFTLQWWKKPDFVQTHFMQHKFKLLRIHVMENRWRMTETPPSYYQLWDQSSSEYAVNTCSVNCFLAIQWKCQCWYSTILWSVFIAS